MAVHLTQHRGGFRHGWTYVTTTWEDEDDTGIGLGVLRLRPGEIHDVATEAETAYLLMSGRVEGTVGELAFGLERRSLFDGRPAGLHLAAGERLNLSAGGEVELAVFTVDNGGRFPPRVIHPEEVASEGPGAGERGEVAWSIARRVVGGRGGPEEAMLVLGETITAPGRWSSWPPHRHPQPQICHFRFTRPEGYGHAELGESVLKVREFDTVRVRPGTEHTHAAAPGYGMYCAWALRHLPEARYAGPEFPTEHRRAIEPGAEPWLPEELKRDG